MKGRIEGLTSVVCPSNLASVDPTGLAKRIADIYLGDEFELDERKVNLVGVVDLRTKAGLYVDLESDDFLTLKFSNRNYLPRVQ